MADHQNDGTGSLTVSSAASLFEDALSGETEDQRDEGVDEEGSEPEEVDDASDEDEEGDQPEESDDEEDDEADPKASRKLRVKTPDGEQEITEEEAKNGYLRTADYTRKTQALAEEKKTFSTEQAAVRGERQQLANQLTQLTDALKNMTPAEPDWDRLREESPADFPLVYADWQRHKARMASVEDARRKAVEDVTRDQIEHTRQFLESENSKLLDAIPTWKDAAVAKTERTALKKFALDAGYTEQELDSVYDHRVMVLLRKAMLFDKGQAAKPALQAKINRVKDATPGAASTTRQPGSRRVKAGQRLAKTGSIRDAAVLMEDFI